MSDAVKIVECPRDAWQGLPVQIAPEVKAGYLRKLIDAGFTHIDAVSFVSPAAIPQMADSERVLELLGPPEKRRDHRDCSERKRRGAGHPHQRGSHAGFSLLHLRQGSSIAIKIRRRKNRSLRCGQSSHRPAPQS